MAVVKNFGSGLALGVGGLGLLSGLAQIGQGNPNGVLSFIFGIECLVGALIYRSAKYRKTTNDKITIFRVIGESIGVLLILFVWLHVSDLKEASMNHPLPFLLGPIWALFAYAYANIRNYEKT